MALQVSLLKVYENQLFKQSNRQAGARSLDLPLGYTLGRCQSAGLADVCDPGIPVHAVVWRTPPFGGFADGGGKDCPTRSATSGGKEGTSQRGSAGSI
jgi:hypothetical protein